MQITCFSQRDPRWQAEKLGTGEPTIGQAGCLITSIVSLLADFGVPSDPHRLNAWLLSHGGYAKRNCFVWSSIAGLGADLVKFVDCETVAAPVDELIAALKNEQGIVIKVDSTPGGKLQQHWVRLVALQKRRGGWIMDPWQLAGSEMISLHDYLMASWETSRGIFAAAVYARNGGATFRVADMGGVHQDQVNLRTGGST